VVRAEKLQARRGLELSSVELLVSSVQEAVKIEYECVKLKNADCKSHCQGTAGEGTAVWEILSACCSEL
jgi:hypothetical protein